MSDLFKLREHTFTGFQDTGAHNWRCYGKFARFFDAVDYGGNCARHIEVIYDERNINRLYQMTICSNNGEPDYAVRWVHPAYFSRLKTEAQKRGFDHAIAWDKVRFRDISAAKMLKELSVALGVASEIKQPVRRKQRLKSR